MRDLLCVIRHAIIFLVLLFSVDRLFAEPTVVWFVSLLMIFIATMVFFIWDLNRKENI